MSGNNIGDNGITAIAKVLGNSQICELYVKKCGITLAGAKSLGTGLLISRTIKKVAIISNSITIEGARLILQSAVNNGVCHLVDIDTEYRCDDKIKRMMYDLDMRKRQVRTTVCVKENKVVLFCFLAGPTFYHFMRLFYHKKYFV